MNAASLPLSPDDTRRWQWLPPVGTAGYYLLLGAIGMLVLGPLGGITAAFMNFSIGFFVGGQVLAGILGSVVTYGYGVEGRHGANYIQTIAASVAGMMAMSTLIQAMVWMGMPKINELQLMVYMGCIAMMAAGIGMLYTPILVDRMQLQYPSGLAVANILRALTDPELLKRSVSRLFGGMGIGLLSGIAGVKIDRLGVFEISASTFGAGMITGARIGIAAGASALVFHLLTPTFIEHGWLNEGDPFRKIAFLIALGMILGAGAVNVTSVAWRMVRRIAEPGEKIEVPEEQRTGPRASIKRLLVWVAFWTVATAACGIGFFHVEPVHMLLAVVLVYAFVIVNGISLGLTDQNPISSTFVVTVLMLAALGLHQPILGLLCAMVVFISSSVAGDMQQDRSTGWRLGTNRTLQFRFQVVGLITGAVLAVLIAKFFMTAYPELNIDQTMSGKIPHWESAMTYKFVGALRSLTEPKPYYHTAILIGLSIGLVTELLRKLKQASSAYQRFVASGKLGFATDFVLDSVVIPSPYASSFGGFVDWQTSAWLCAGGVTSSLINTLAPKAPAGEDELPSDMSSTSLVGGGLIAGDALAALGLGVIGLLSVI